MYHVDWFGKGKRGAVSTKKAERRAKEKTSFFFLLKGKNEPMDRGTGQLVTVDKEGS